MQHAKKNHNETAFKKHFVFTRSCVIGTPSSSGGELHVQPASDANQCELSVKRCCAGAPFKQAGENTGVRAVDSQSLNTLRL
jgi:hypothetical protein